MAIMTKPIPTSLPQLRLSCERGQVGIEAYADPTKRQSFIGQANLEWRGDTGGIGHVLLIGGGSD